MIFHIASFTRHCVHELAHGIVKYVKIGRGGASPLWSFLEEGNAFPFYLFCSVPTFPPIAIAVICIVDRGAQLVIAGAVLKYC